MPGRFAFPGEVLMSTFAQPRTLTQRITDAKRTLDQTRQDGHQPYIEAAERVLNGLIDRLPRHSTAEE
ncbi:hypothetical protein AWB98_29300 [Mycolicibacterium conceptionense]|uniref:Uncharacterized protein n=1 Tax=Mycolicibacterium conceptionense TaxID=451644 RepID=A0ABX3V0W7_9MYCO|nr:hypothetical protein AWB98_29300 [Mycolicibacterium conceptionense]